jgi:hypothetical protein
VQACGPGGQRVDHAATRTLAAWTARLHELGFAVASEPMYRGTPFANVLLVGTVAGAPLDRDRAADGAGDA